MEEIKKTHKPTGFNLKIQGEGKATAWKGTNFFLIFSEIKDKNSK